MLLERSKNSGIANNSISEQQHKQSKTLVSKKNKVKPERH
uniref:Uncharacterized protein n=1 Tax=Arundo donax TaxID=35708 RepID=A0A0A9FR05_ARUDO